MKVENFINDGKKVVMTFLAIAATVLLIARCSTPALAHPEVILKCDRNLKVDRVQLVQDPVVLDNGMISERYDRNGDGNVDIETLSIAVSDDAEYNPTDGAYKFVHRRFPLFYVVDLDYDGQPDAVYIDQTAEGVNDPKGHCDNVVLYEDLSKMRTTEDPKPDFDKKNSVTDKYHEAFDLREEEM